MKTNRLFILITALLLMTISMQAQEVNKVYIPKVKAIAGEKTVLPVAVQNTSTKITGIQFTIEVEKGISVDINNAQMTDRLSNHKLKVSSKGNGKYTVMIYSSDNTVLTGSDGSILDLPISVADTVKAGREKTVVLSKAVLSDNLGNNVLTETAAENIYIKVIPQLKLAAASRELKEGDKMFFTITNEIAPQEPLNISISSDMPGRLKYPSSVTMSANASTVTFEVEAIDNGEVTDTLTAAITISATDHKSDEFLLLVIDDDMPEIDLEIKPDIVSEGDGATAIAGKVIRKTNKDKIITIILSDDSNSRFTYSNNKIVMQAGETEAEFTMGVIDNSIVEEEHHFTVTAAVFIPSCSCSAKGTSIGVASKQITVTDDDGPTLKISSSNSSVVEGSTITLTITHNVDTKKDITVTLSSDDDDTFEYDHNVVIPAGQKSKEVLVKVKENETIDGIRNVVFTVTTEGYATGTCRVQLTDQMVPDVSISSFTVTPTELEALQKATMSVTLKNEGIAVLPSLARINFYIKNSNKEIGHAYTPDTLTVGGEMTISQEFEMPNLTGDYNVIAIANENKAIKELTYSNNSSQEVSISLRAAFTATVQTDKSIYSTGDTVTFSGIATGTKAANSYVEVYFIHEGYRHTITAQTDENGNYSVKYALPKTLSGHFAVGACYPQENLYNEMTAFDVFGLRLSIDDGDCKFELGETFTGTMTIINPTSKQTGLKVIQNASSDNCVFNFDLPEIIEAYDSVKISFIITPNAISTGNKWQEMPITIISNEGASIDYYLRYFVMPNSPLLSTDITEINTTVMKGSKRNYPITIRNQGKGETGKISLALPEWIKTSTPREMASMSQGDSAIIVLQFAPTDNMQLNVPITGTLGINCENGSGTPIKFSITPVSDSKGKLIVDVVDEFTFETKKAPHVKNAKIEIKSPTTGELIAQGYSSDDGKFSVTLPEGNYSIKITAENHEDYNNNIMVDPGKDNHHEAFISYEAVTYSWEVVETEVEDSYEIETIVKYETRVPKPIILISLPQEKPQEGSIIPIVVTNKGYINAKDVKVSLAISDPYRFEFLTEPYLATLAANQSELFYAKVSSNEPARASKRASSSSNCMALKALANAHYDCGSYDNIIIARDYRSWGKCSGSGLYTGGLATTYGSSWWQNVPISTKSCSPGSNGSGNNESGDNGSGDNDDEEPEEQDCDKEPELNYKLVSVDGSNYEYRGVAADGVSQLKIVFGKDCKVPSEDCDWTCSWSLENDNGKIGKLDNTESWDGVIYTAPVDFPSEIGSKYPIKAKITYTNGKESSEKYVDIELIRVPVVLLHGLNSSANDCWADYKTQLVNSLLYEDWQIKNYNYEWTHNSHFRENYDKPGIAITLCKYEYLKRGYHVTQADLVGHSMGGILSRFHVQKKLSKTGKQDVHKLITVNTPHSGSEIGDIATLDPLFASWAYIAGFRPLDAVKDLAVNSSAIDSDLNGAERINGLEIPVYAITTVSLGSSVVATGAISVLQRIISLYNHSVEYALMSPSDAVVSLESQQGGCSAVSQFNGPNHLESTKDKNVKAKLTELLSCPTKIFSKGWFNPANRVFAPVPVFSPKRSAPADSHGGVLGLSTKIEGDSVFITIDDNENYSEHLIITDFGYNNIYSSNSTKIGCEIPSTFSGDIKVYVLEKDNNGNIISDSTFINVPQTRTQIESIKSENIVLLVGDTIFTQVTCKWKDGSETSVIPDNYVTNKKLIEFDNNRIVALKTGNDTITYAYKGKICNVPITILSLEDNAIPTEPQDNESSNSVCSTITLSFKQEMVMTRQAFRGILTVNNGNSTNEMKDVKLNLEVKDEEGNIASAHEFQINAESLEGFKGDVDLTSGWTLDAKGTGVATVLFIPTKYAAPTEPKKWSFGGTFSYIDPSTGLAVTKVLYPVILTVKPSPNLAMDYFMQRDVLGDDALTEDIIEPMVPAEFSLLIKNKGYGDATNVKMVTNQPEIIDNEKGLLIDFEILSSQLNGGDKTLALGQSVATDFGTIPAGKTSYAQWWFTSSLLGHFTEYDVKSTHLTSYGNPDLSLLDTVAVHELIHTLTIPKAESMRGFLVNDEKDTQDLPDMLYMTDGTLKAVAQASATFTENGNNTYTLTAEPEAAGWNYGNLIDPTNGHKMLSSVTRNSDGTSISLNNFWQTDRTLRDGKDPLYEYRLHFADEMAATGETYTLTFEDKPMTILDIDSIVGVSEGINESIEKVTVYFNKDVAASTFTTEDLELRRAGIKLDVEKIGITKITERQFELDLKPLTIKNGYYVLTVQLAGIKDTESYYGEYGRQLSWTQFVDGNYATVTKAPVGLTLIYTGDDQALVEAGEAKDGKMVYSLDGTSFSEDIPAASALGDYIIYYKVIGDESHNDTQKQSVTSCITGFELTIAPGEFATYYDTLALSLSPTSEEGIALYTVSKVTNTEAILSNPIATAEANTPLLVYNGTGTEQKVMLIPSSDVIDLLTVADEFKGTAIAIDMFASTDEMNYFVCTGKQFTWVRNAGTLAAHRCWLQIGKGGNSSARRSIVFGESPTDINGLINEDDRDNIYDLLGRKINNKKKGLNIVNGKKIVFMK